MVTTTNPGEGKECDSQNERVIKFKCLVYNNDKITRHTKKQ